MRAAANRDEEQPQPVICTKSIAVKSTHVDNSFETISFTVNGKSVGKPRMTRRDQWIKRPCVLRYRDYCDRIRSAAGSIPPNPDKIQVVVYIAVPKSWSKKKKAEMDEKPHRSKPDADNLLKAVVDGMFKEDSCIWSKLIEKFWCQPGEERTEIRVLYQRP